MKKNKNTVINVASLITLRDPKSRVAEAYRTLRTNLEFSSFDIKIHTILFTSATPDEGKSEVAANLGTSIAMDGKKVLILDADLRNPTQYKLFNIKNNVGLTNLLVSESMSLEVAICGTSTENLFVLPSGPIPPNPAELLNSQKIRNLFTSLEDTFDLILVDSPPVMAVTDASILASYLDGTLLVVESGRADKEQTRLAVEQLQKVKARLLGAVLNKAPYNGRGYYNYYYSHKL